MRFVFVIFLLFILNAASGQVTVTFRNSTYKGDTIFLRTVADYITGFDIVIAKGVVDEKGDYTCKFPLKKTALIKIPLYFFEGMLYAEPGQTYHIILPKKTPVPVQADVSPFFSPMPFYAYLPEGIPDELNNLIFTFDSIYDDYISKNSSRLLFEAYNSKVDTFITKIENDFGKYRNVYFKTYMSSKMAMLHYMTKKRDLYYVVNYYLNPMPVSIENNAYMELFNNLFRDFFRFYAMRKEGETLFDDVAKAKSPYAIRQTLSLNPVFVNDTLNELMILKGIHDAFFPGNENIQKEYPHIQLYLTLDSMKIQNKYPFTHITCENIFEKACTRYKTIEYRNIKLTDCNNEQVALSTLRSKYVYMTFYDTRNYSCQKELKQIVKLAKKHESYTQFVIVVVNPDKGDFAAFCKKNNFTFPVLYAPPGSEIYGSFNITDVPQYMFFDPYGYAVMTNAPAPSENFEATMLNIIEKNK